MKIGCNFVGCSTEEIKPLTLPGSASKLCFSLPVFESFYDLN